MQDVSEDLIREVFSRSVEAPVVLVTLEAEGFDQPIRASSDPDGTISRGETYPYFPFSFAWGGAAQDETAKQARIEIGNTDGAIAYAIRTAEEQPRLTVELVRRAAPDVVEMAMVDARLTDAEVDDPKVSGTIKPRAFSEEPACKARYIASRTPGLF